MRARYTRPPEKMECATADEVLPERRRADQGRSVLADPRFWPGRANSPSAGRGHRVRTARLRRTVPARARAGDAAANIARYTARSASSAQGGRLPRDAP